MSSMFDDDDSDSWYENTRKKKTKKKGPGLLSKIGKKLRGKSKKLGPKVSRGRKLGETNATDAKKRKAALAKAKSTKNGTKAKYAPMKKVKSKAKPKPTKGVPASIASKSKNKVAARGNANYRAATDLTPAEKRAQASRKKAAASKSGRNRKAAQLRNKRVSKPIIKGGKKSTTRRGTRKK